MNEPTEFECPECGTQFSLTYSVSWGTTSNADCCPFCGAVMDYRECCTNPASDAEVE